MKSSGTFLSLYLGAFAAYFQFSFSIFFLQKIGRVMFFGQHLFHVIYNHNLGSNVHLKTPFGQPDRRFPVFFGGLSFGKFPSQILTISWHINPLCVGKTATACISISYFMTWQDNLCFDISKCLLCQCSLSAGTAEKLGVVGKSGDLGPQPTECWPLMAPDGAAVKRSPFLLPIPGLVFYTFCRLASLQEGVWVTLVEGFYGRLPTRITHCLRLKNLFARYPSIWRSLG